MVRPWLNLAVSVIAVLVACMMTVRLEAPGPHWVMSQMVALSGAAAYLLMDLVQVQWSLRQQRRARHARHAYAAEAR